MTALNRLPVPFWGSAYTVWPGGVFGRGSLWWWAESFVYRCLLRAREGREERVIQEELDALRAELVAARDVDDADSVADTQAEWRNRLRRTLRFAPQAEAELGFLLNELKPSAGEQ